MLKAKALKQLYLKQKATSARAATAIYTEMEATYHYLLQQSYQEIPYEVYEKWLKR